jgi:hypothetical protein
MRGYVGPADGYMGNVLRIVPAVVFLLVVAAGCGGGKRPQRTADRGVPRGLALNWEDRASAIAAAASAGQDCRALQLARSLRHDVVESRQRLPVRLRSPVLLGVRALAERLRCTPPAVRVKTSPPKPRKPEPPPKPHGPAGPPKPHEHSKPHEHDGKPHPPEHGDKHGGDG